MMFRKLYWVTEQIQNGDARVTGVFTSVPDLIKSGLHWHGEPSADCTLRLALVKLDSSKGPLGQWDASTLSNLESDLQPFVKTDEFRQDEILDLVSALRSFLGTPAV